MQHGGSIIEPMAIDMNEAQVRTVGQVRHVHEGTQELQFHAAEDDDGRYGWIDAVLAAAGLPPVGALGPGSGS